MRIPVCEPEIGKEEIKNVLLCLKDKQISGTGGTYVSEFEDKFSNYCNAKYGIATSSGTTAIHLALAAIGIKKGDEVIVSNLTNIATVYGVVYSGATPVLVDCERKTWNIDPAQIQDKITKRTRAIMVVHLYGHPVDMTPVLNIARKHGLYLIEDAAESHGAEYRGKRVGCLGDIGCFSFYANKIITTGEGGMVVTKNRDIYERAQLLKNLAFSRKRRFFHYHIGFNYRMTNIQAAMGLAQLERIGEILKKKIYNAQVYNSLLDGTDGIVLPPSEPWARNVYWMYSILITARFGMHRDKLMKLLKDRGIETRSFFIPMHKQPAFKNMGLFLNGSYPVAEDLARKGLYLPSGPGLKRNQIKYVCNAIREIQRKNG